MKKEEKTQSEHWDLWSLQGHSSDCQVPLQQRDGQLAGTACLQWLDNVQPAASREEMLYIHGAVRSCFGCCSSMPRHGSKVVLAGTQIRVASKALAAAM